MKTEEEIISDYIAREKAREFEVLKVTRIKEMRCDGHECETNESLTLVNFDLRSGIYKLEWLCSSCAQKAESEMKMQRKL